MFQLAFDVRDNEIDIHGIVNNSNYLIYLAHARHKYLQTLGLSFSEMSKNKQFLLLVESHLKFKKPLVAEERFVVNCSLLFHSPIKFCVNQNINKLDDKNTLVLASSNICVCIDGNKSNKLIYPISLKIT